ncbi:hypothetical protein RAS1_25680 [Phycisphaerae bacterium RAS1]|nr:hypothetical protein RAS1_25680 [Phycisphaerae bacterium RAS1]
MATPINLVSSDRPRLASFVALLGPALLLIIAALRCIWEVDFWWQLKTGEYVAQHGIPTVDVFSYTMTGQPWIELRWLYCLLLHYVVSWGGVDAAILGKVVILLASFALVTAPLLRADNSLAAAVTLMLAILAAQQRFFVRPELVTYLMFGLFVWLIARYRRRPGPLLWILPALQVAWTNAHTTFILGPLIVGLLFAAMLIETAVDRRHPPRRLLAVTGVLSATAAACLANPYGLSGALFPFQLLSQIRGTVFKQYISEFRGPLEFGGAFTAVLYYEILIAMCLVAAAGALWRTRRLDAFWSLLCVSQLYLSILAIRNLPLFSLAAVPFVLAHFGAAPAGRAANPGASPLRSLLTLAVLAACVLESWEIATDRAAARQGDTNQFGLGIAERRFPSRAYQFLREAGLDGRIFSTMAESSYLLYHDVPVFSDPRLEVYGESHFGRAMRMQENTDEWRAAAAEFRFEVTFVGIGSSMLNRLEENRDNWRLVYFDDVVAVHLRNGYRTDLPRIETAAEFEHWIVGLRALLPPPRPWEQLGPFERATSTAWYTRVAQALLVWRRDAHALPFARDAVAAFPGATAARFTLAVTLDRTGDAPAAARAYEEYLALQPADSAARRRLATLYIALGRSKDAAGLAP